MLTQMTEMFRGLADPTRLRLLNLLLDKGEVCVSDLVRALEVSQPFVSRHLAYLKHSGWVQSRRERIRVNYSLRPDMGPPARTILEALRTEAERDPVFKGDLARLNAMLGTSSGQTLGGPTLDSSN